MMLVSVDLVLFGFHLLFRNALDIDDIPSYLSKIQDILSWKLVIQLYVVEGPKHRYIGLFGF